MKKLIILITLVFFTLQGFMQEAPVKDEKKENDEIKTIFGNKPIVKGSYFSLHGSYNKMYGREVFVGGIQFGHVINHWFNSGITTGVLLTGVNFYDPILDNYSEFRMGYAGLFFEPTLLPKMPVHLTFPCMAGVGYGFIYDRNGSYYDNWDDLKVIDDDFFFIAQPGAEIEINVFKHLRIGFGAKYRYIRYLTLDYTRTADLTGMFYGATLKLGKF